MLCLFPRRTCCLWRWAVFSITSASREPFRFSASTPTSPAVSGDDLLMRYLTGSHDFHFCFKAFLKAIFGSTCLWYAFFFFFTRSSRSRTTSHRQRSPSGQTTEWWSGSAPWIWQNTPQIWEAAVFMEDWWWDGRRIRGQFGWIQLNFTIPLGNNYGLSKLKNMLKEILLQK